MARHRSAHAMLASIFVLRGASSLQDPKPLLEPAAPVIDALRGPLGITTDTATLVRVNGGVQAAAGLGLALGILPRASAVLLAGSLVPTTLAGHGFWREQDPAKRHGAETDFLKNLAIMGGLLLVATERGSRRRLKS